VERFGRGRLVANLRGDDFTALKNHMTKRWGPPRVADFIQHVRSVFKYAFDTELLDRPVRFGPGFSRSSQKTIRLHKAGQGPKLFTREEIRRLVSAAGVQLEAMILFGVNCGFGNTDVATLPLSALNLETGWLDYPRPKTSIPRRCPLWPETVEDLKEVLARRPKPKEEHASLAFLSVRGTPVVSVREKDRTDGMAVAFGNLLRKVGINSRKGLGFYTLRHTFRTVADEARDQPAANCIMGHEIPRMSSVYRERISDERLKAVTDHVRNWLFAAPTAETPKAEPKSAGTGDEEE
jgi:integrase